jgi:hypothetical protein
MQNMLNAIKETGAFLKQQGIGTPRVGIVLGTGFKCTDQ